MKIYRSRWGLLPVGLVSGLVLAAACGGSTVEVQGGRDAGAPDGAAKRPSLEGGTRDSSEGPTLHDATTSDASFTCPAQITDGSACSTPGASCPGTGVGACDTRCKCEVGRWLCNLCFEEPDAHVADARMRDARPKTPDSSPGIDAGACPAPTADGGFWPYDSPASGSIEGPDVDGHICNLAVAVLQNNNGTFLEVGSYQGTTTIQFSNPKAGEDPLVDGLLPVSASPATYTSSDPVNCGNIQVDYSLPPPPGLVCSGTTPPTCPAGCTSGCSGQGCEPCVPNPPFFGYLASGETGGICAETYTQPGPLSGSWTITLTSVVPYEGTGPDEGASYFVVHGSLSAMLSGGGPDGGTEPATLSLDF